MTKVGYSLIVAIVIFSATVSYSYSSMGDLVTTAWPIHESFESGDYPKIVGNVEDQGGNPIEGANVKVAFATETVSTTTNSVGSFIIESTTVANPGDYTVNVIATKEGYGTDIVSSSYFVKGQPQSVPELDLTVVNQVPSLIEEGVTKNPLSQIIFKHMEDLRKQQEAEEKKRQELQKEQDFLNEQRRLAQISLESELQNFEKTLDLNTPRIAFGRFVQTVDDTVQVIFWGQFNLTEQKHNEAFAAKENALKEGDDSIEAMKKFQRKASISKGEITDYNSELNVKYGFAQKSSQDFFDAEGKLRWNENSLSNQTVFSYLKPDG